jgi:Zn-finger nucleic acid-binding protein
MHLCMDGVPLPPRSSASDLDSVPVAASGQRVLIACAKCARQYDTTGLAAGTRVRCECGAILTVEARSPIAARAIACGRCGGKVDPGASACVYCGAEITLEERGLSGVCPCCYARLLAGARYCTACGVKIEPQAVRACDRVAACPRCAGRLQSRALETIAFVECGSCAGLWLEPKTFESICEDAEKQELARRHLCGTTAPRDGASAISVAAASKPGYLACIACGDLMVRRNFGGSSGVIIDVCRGHGVWLDHRELERVLDFVRAGGLDRAHEREIALLEARAARARNALNGANLDLSSFGGGDADVSGSFGLLGDRREGSSLARALHWLESVLERGS